MTLMPDKFRLDYELLEGAPFTWRSWFKVLSRGSMLMAYFGRVSEAPNLVGKIAHLFHLWIARSRGCEITYSEKIQGGLAFAHAYAITVNVGVRTGQNVILYKGCTLGGIRSGVRRGVPILGSHVVIGLNATVCGGVMIGDDVFIAPGAFVNFDVPDHSVVVGNPGVIHAKQGATRDYFRNVR